jgi:hypothetical protein
MRLSRSLFTLRESVALIAVCAVVLALLITPGALLAMAIGIVLPGFVIDRVRGRTGIIGGMMSSSVLSVGLGIVYAYVPGQSSFGDIVEACPTLYLLFVGSLIWGGIASTTLYWVMNASRDRGQRGFATGRRIQFTLRQLMWVIVVCAVVFASLSTPAAVLVVAFAIVLPGFIIDRFRGGAGIIGGMMSAAFSLVCLGIAVYTYYSLYLDPATLNYLGPPPLTLLPLGTAGLVWGALASTLLDVFIIVAVSYSHEKPLTDDWYSPIIPDAEEKTDP